MNKYNSIFEQILSLFQGIQWTMQMNIIPGNGVASLGCL
jgi:hypothetical protein